MAILILNKQYKSMKDLLLACAILLLSGLAASFEQTPSILYGFEDKSAARNRLDSIQQISYLSFSHQQPLNTASGSPNSSTTPEKLKDRAVEDLLAYSATFRLLKFNLEEQELRNLAYAVRDLYAQDKIALFFISAYFIQACEKLEKLKTPTPKIAKIIKEKIKLMMDITSIENFRRQKYGYSNLVLPDSGDWKKIESHVVPMTPKKFQLQPQSKDEQIQHIIVAMVHLAEAQFPLFDFLTRAACDSPNCLSRHVNFKIKNQQQRPQMKRVKEKLLRDHFKNHAQMCLNTFLNIGWKRKIEEAGFQNLLRNVYDGLEEVQFVVKDILRAKCMFSQVSQVYRAGLSLVSRIQQLSEQGLSIKLVEFQNRLDKITCDIMLIVQIGELPCQIQLSLDFDENLFEISHKMYEISRSKVFSPIVLLFDWFEKVAPEFLLNIGQFFLRKYGNPTMIPWSQGKPQKLMKQYELLNEFFHLTAYHDLGKIPEEEYEKQMQDQISNLTEGIIEPFTRIGDEL